MRKNSGAGIDPSPVENENYEANILPMSQPAPASCEFNYVKYQNDHFKGCNKIRVYTAFTIKGNLKYGAYQAVHYTDK